MIRQCPAKRWGSHGWVAQLHPIRYSHSAPYSNSIIITQHSTLSAKNSALNTLPQCLKLSTQHSALSTQHPTLSTQHSALSTQHSAFNTQQHSLPVTGNPIRWWCCPAAALPIGVGSSAPECQSGSARLGCKGTNQNAAPALHDTKAMQPAGHPCKKRTVKFITLGIMTGVSVFRSSPGGLITSLHTVKF